MGEHALGRAPSHARQLPDLLGDDGEAASVLAGSGGFDAAKSEAVMRETFAGLESAIEATIVRYRPPGRR